MGLSGFSALDHYRLGQCVAEAVEALGRRAVFVASGDLSHKLKADGPYGFAPEGPVFDQAVTDTMASGDFPAIPDHGRRPLRPGRRVRPAVLPDDGRGPGRAGRFPRLLSHEGTFGVGYAVALFPVTGRDPRRCYGPPPVRPS